MIYMAATTNDSFLAEMDKEPYPFILLGYYADGVNVLCARSDDLLGAKLATEHLIKLGHKAIGHLAGSNEVSQGRDREKGYREAMKEAGLVVDSSWILRGNYDLKASEKATVDLLEAKVTAIFAGSDVMAYGAMRAIILSGRKIPDDVAVVGMDDLDLSAWMTPPLTTVRYDIRAMAELATRFVIRRLQSPLTDKSALGEMPAVQLIIRSSCGAQK
jgi:LacI family transcriptional regulator